MSTCDEDSDASRRLQVTAAFCHSLEVSLMERCAEREDVKSDSIRVSFTSTEEAGRATVEVVSPALPLFSISVSVRFVGGNVYDLSMPISEGGGWTRTFTFPSSGRPLTSMPKVGAEAGEALMSEMDRRRTKAGKEVPPHVPRIEVNRNGDIEQINGGARRALEYSSDAPIQSCFFSHIHEHSLERVMRELAQLIEQKIQRTRWLLQLRTGAKRYRWFRAQAESVLHKSTIGVRVLLRPL